MNCAMRNWVFPPSSFRPHPCSRACSPIGRGGCLKTSFVMSSTLHAHQTHWDECEMESGLIFNQLICEFESRHPCQNIFDCRLPIADLSIATLDRGSNRKSSIDMIS